MVLFYGATIVLGRVNRSSKFGETEVSIAARREFI